MRIQGYFICLWAFIALGRALYAPHSASTSQYIHSNDTIALYLDKTEQNVLHGAPGSVHTLTFTLVNKAGPAHFTFRKSSEDGFVGIFQTSPPDTHLSSGQQQNIVVTDLRVPNRPEGSKVRLSITAIKDSGYQKREAPPPNLSQVGGGSSIGGGSSNHPNGNMNNNNNYPGNNNNYPGTGYNPNDPSQRRELTVTVEFTVTADLRDTSDPWTQLIYGAETEEDTCSVTPEDTDCYRDFWWVKFIVQDEESGLNTVQFSPIGSDKYGTPIYYRYENFNLGTDKEYEIVAAASCCLEGLTLRLTDIAGNQAEHEAHYSGVGKEMSPGLFWGLIGGGILVVILIIVGVVLCCRRNSGYNAASTG